MRCPAPAEIGVPIRAYRRTARQRYAEMAPIVTANIPLQAGRAPTMAALPNIFYSAASRGALQRSSERPQHSNHATSLNFARNRFVRHCPGRRRIRRRELKVRAGGRRRRQALGRACSRSDHGQCRGPVRSVSCSIGTVTRRQMAAPA
jgi:hypothetical protein